MGSCGYRERYWVGQMYRIERRPMYMTQNTPPTIREVETTRAGTSSAPDVTVTVAPFRAWRDWRPIVAKKPTRAAIEVAIRG
jgi:hypothetical protein